MNNTLLFPNNIQEENHKLPNFNSPTILFPGELKEETSHTIITPITTNYTSDYLKAENALSELDTPELKAKARENLEITNKVEWGNIQGELDNQEDLKQYLEDNTDVKIKEPIPVAGGPLANLLNNAGITQIEADTNFQDLMFTLLCQEKWPSPVATYSYGTLTSTLAAPTATNPTGNGTCVKVGTTITLNKVTATNASANTPKLTFDNFTWGYATTTGKHTATTTETNPNSVNATVSTDTNGVIYTLSKSYNKFNKTSSDSTSVTGSNATQLSFASESVVVGLGENSVTYSLSVNKQIHSATVQAPSVYYALSNLGNTDKKIEGVNVTQQVVDATKSKPLNPSPAIPTSKSKSDIKIYGVYPVYTNVGSTANTETPTKEIIGSSITTKDFTITYKVGNAYSYQFAFPSGRFSKAEIYNSAFGTWGDVPSSNNVITSYTQTIDGNQVPFKVNNQPYDIWTYGGNVNSGEELKFRIYLKTAIGQ